MLFNSYFGKNKRLRLLLSPFLGVFKYINRKLKYIHKGSEPLSSQYRLYYFIKANFHV